MTTEAIATDHNLLFVISVRDNKQMSLLRASVCCGSRRPCLVLPASSRRWLCMGTYLTEFGVPDAVQKWERRNI